MSQLATFAEEDLYSLITLDDGKANALGFAMFEAIGTETHEEVLFGADRESGLRTIDIEQARERAQLLSHVVGRLELRRRPQSGDRPNRDRCHRR